MSVIWNILDRFWGSCAGVGIGGWGGVGIGWDRMDWEGCLSSG